jgi:hypothetical protein
MLRWMVLVLVVVNAAYFAWQQYLAGGVSTAPAVPAARPQGDSLQLVGGGSAPARSAASEAVVPVCHMIGPFGEQVSARQVRDRLRSLEIAVDLYEFSVPTRSDYWVHLGPMASRKGAVDLLRELQAKGIDSFLITEGELVNGISLGFFSREDLAQAVLRERQQQGYRAAIREVPRFSSELWAVFAEDAHSEFSEQLWQQIAAGTRGLERRKNLCDAIASARRLE